MAAPSYVQASSGSTDAGGAWTATGAAGTSGNIVILQVLQDGSTSGAVTLTSATNIENLAGTDNAWTSIGSFAVGSPTSAYQHIWIGRLINTSAPTASGGNTTSEDLYWRFMEVSNVNTGTTLAEVMENATAGSTANTAGTDGTVTDAGVTTLGPDRLALNFPSINDDNSQSAFSMPTGSYEWLYRTHYAESSGTDGSIGVQTWRPCWNRNQQSTTNGLNAVAYGNGYYVALGSSGALYYATDPAGTWTSNTQGSTTFNGVAYGNGYWVAVGDNGALYYKASTPDGAWTSNTQGTITLRDVAYGNGYWVAVGGVLPTSPEQLLYKSSTPDGTWTQNLPGSSSELHSCEYGNGYWVVSGSGGFYYRATDPTSTWTFNASPGTPNESRYVNGYWVVGTNPIKYRASDPTSTFSTSSYGASINAVAYGNGYYVFAGVSNDTYTATAIDGPWTTYAQTMGGDVRYLNGYFVGVGLAGLIKYATDPLEPRIVAATIDGGTFTNSDATDGWGCVGFALIGTTKTSLLRPHRYHLIRR